MTVDVVKLYNVVLPAWIWPGKVIMWVGYTKAAAEEFIEDYPGRWLAMWMRIEEQEVIARETD